MPKCSLFIAHSLSLVMFFLTFLGPAAANNSGQTAAKEGVTFQLQLTKEENDWIREKKVINIGGPRFFPPFHFYDKKENLHGISAEIIGDILKTLNVKTKIYRNIPWTEVLAKASSGEIDLVPCIGKTGEREMFLDFSDPYLSFPLVIVSRKEGRFFGDIKDLYGEKIAMVKKTLVPEWLEKDGIVFSPVYVKSPLKALEAVSFGKADALIENIATVSYLIQERGLNNLKVAAPTPYENYTLNMATPKNSPHLLSIINKAIRTFPKERQAQIRNNWLAVRYEYGVRVWTIITWVLVVLSLAGCVLLAFFFWNRKLKAEIQVRMQVEKALRESEERLKAAGESIYDLIYEWDVKNNNIIWFGNLREFLGYNEDEMTNDVDDWIKLIHPDDYERLITALAHHTRSTDLIDYEFRLRHRKGHYIHSYVNGRPLIDGTGLPYRWLGVCADISLKKEAELKLSRAAQEWQKTFDSMKSSLWVLDDQQRIIRSNKAAEDMFSIPVESIIGKYCWDIICGKKASEKDCLSLIAKKQHQRESTEKQIGEKWFEITIDPILTDNGRYEGALQVITDITERKLAEEEKKQLEGHLQQAQKMEAIGNLAGGIAHDFNNMLGVIMGNISYTLSRLNGYEDLQKALIDAQQGAKQAQQLTHQLLTFSKGGEPIKKITDINKLVEDSAQLMARGSKSICDFDLADNLWPAEVDAGQLNQVFNNLCINSIQAMPDGGKLTIKTKNIELNPEGPIPISGASCILIRLSDTGAGIPEKYLTKIFDPFFTTKNTGTGLGLATTFSIIKRHGGHISVESVAGEKTVFDIYLPADKGKHVEDAVEKEATHSGSGRILIMDDQEPILDIAERMLNQSGYETVTATDGAEAVALFKKAKEAGQDFDLVILDLTVPGGMGGADTLPELMALDENVKAVVSSGYSNDPIMARYRDYGFSGIIPKPYTLSDFSKMLNTVFGEK